MQPTNKDYYKVLGVTESSSTEDIKSAYRKLAKKFHPDMNPGDRKGAETKFKEISEAYYVLGDEKRKQEYDMFRKGGFRSAGGPQGYTYSGAQDFDIDDLLSHMGFSTKRQSRRAGGQESRRSGAQAGMGYDIFDDILGDMFSGGERRGFSTAYTSSRGAKPQQSVNTDLNAAVEIPSKLAVEGGKIDVSIPGKKSVTITIPKGVTNGTKLRLAGLGNPCPCCEKKGDLLLKVNVM